MGYKIIPDIVVGRLPIYLRELVFLDDEGSKVTSSQELGGRLGISPTQIRKDLSYFGEFGKQGTGYDVRYLQGQLRRILKIETVWKVALVGFGDLGRALANYGGFVDRGFCITHVFDNDPQKIGLRAGNLEVMGVNRMAEVIGKNGIKVAIVAVPAGAAQQVAQALVDSGVGAILNYAPITLALPGHVHVQNIDPGVYLQQMTYYL